MEFASLTWHFTEKDNVEEGKLWGNLAEMWVIVSVMLPSVESDLGECVEATASNMDNYTG